MTHSVEIEKHPLKPFLPANAKLLMLGSFPPPKARWKMDFYYPNFQNDMWKIFGLCFFQDKNYFLNIEQKTFKEQQIRTFLNERGIAIFDTAYEVIRQKGNASDKFLHIITPTNIQHLLEQIPDCHSVMTTGDKATDTLMLSMPTGTLKPQIGMKSETHFAGRDLRLYRMPSSSRAYPLALEKKAEAYQNLFSEIGLL
ncbi:MULTISPECIES: uracil-DNA glycosylase family protein [Acinetobacter]|uniref:uracil-DNA glycosylase family protein n=1 Tax=Acinetobacter TaxID=469 RepID=UPI00143C5287|nr:MULTISPECIES: uracil-DNA glycosylase family protein [Acinetobacter]MDD0801210.1 uracil-DNA glycosylase family protein [Acinetobacter sp. Gutcm_16]MDH1698825.1 uracil-DNA glycosylase family protein [Acinetobacter johnsonii]NKG38847.1 DNA glycosylase [Acinetobacter johnsonii]